MKNIDKLLLQVYNLSMNHKKNIFIVILLTVPLFLCIGLPSADIIRRHISFRNRQAVFHNDIIMIQPFIRYTNFPNIIYINETTSIKLYRFANPFIVQFNIRFLDNEQGEIKKLQFINCYIKTMQGETIDLLTTNDIAISITAQPYVIREGRRGHILPPRRQRGMIDLSRIDLTRMENELYITGMMITFSNIEIDYRINNALYIRYKVKIHFNDSDEILAIENEYILRRQITQHERRGNAQAFSTRRNITLEAWDVFME